MVFGKAIELLRVGKMVARMTWDGKYVFKQVPSNIPQSVVPNMTSLPQSVKDKIGDTQTGLFYRNQLALMHPDGTIDSWSPSSEDIFAIDWCEVK